MSTKYISIPLVFDRERFGQWAEHKRLSDGYTKTAIGELTDMSGSQVAKIERGEKVGLDYCLAIANLYDMSHAQWCEMFTLEGSNHDS